MDGWLHPVHFYLDKPIGRCIDIAAELLINEEIRDREVRVIGADGAQLGILPLRKALELAEEAELDWHTAYASPRIRLSSLTT